MGGGRLSQLRISTLGGLRVEVDGRALDDVPAKGHALLAHLAVVGAPVTRSRLAGLLWSDMPEAAARANLRLTLSKLRSSVLQVRADRTSIWLEEPWWIDVAALEALTADGDDPAAVLELAHGDFLDGVELPNAELFTAWAAAQQVHVRSAVLALLDAAIDHALRVGATDVGVAAARRILEFDPVNEQAHRALMQLFADAGQPSAALAQFDTCMHVLFEDLGERPTERTAALADEIRRSATVDRAVPPLPRAGTSFVGRHGELDRLLRLFDDPACRLVTVVGPGGSGKTRLSVEFAATRRSDGHDVAFVSLAGVPPVDDDAVAELVLTTLAAGLDIDLVAERDPLDVLVERISHHALLLVVDNLEHLPGANVVLGRVLGRAERLRMLATSRRRLGIGAEWVVALDGLPTPAPGAFNDLLRYDAVRLFNDRALAAGAGGHIDLAAVADVCRAVDGMPLAIELAARRVVTVPLTEIRARLGRDLDLLGGAVDPDLRHRSMRRALDWSWELLDAPLARSFAQLAVFPSSFDAAAADAVASVSLSQLAELAEQSLLMLADDGRYRMHQLVRQYAADHLDAEDEAALAASHAAWTAKQLRQEKPGELDAVDLDDVRTATEWQIAHADPDDLAGYLRDLAELYRRRSYWAELRTIAEAALDRPDVGTVASAELLGLVSDAHRNVGKPGDAIRLAHQALATLGRAPPDTRRGRLRWMAGYAGTFAACKLGLARSDRRRDIARVRSERLLSLGELYYVGEQFDRTPPIVFGGFVEGHVSGDPSALAIADVYAALAAAVAGRHGIARRYADRSTARARDPRVSPPAAAQTFVGSAVVGLAQGTWDDVALHVTRGRDVCERGALHRSAALVMLLGSIARYHAGGYHDAMSMADEIADGARQRGATPALLWADLVWAESAVRVDRLNEAAARARHALELTDRVDARIDRVRAMVVLARVAITQQRFDDAARHLTAAAGELADRPAYVAYAAEAFTGVPEVALDLIAAGHGDRHGLDGIIDRGLVGLRTYVRAVPIAAPRRDLIAGRAARMHGRERSARRLLQRALHRAGDLAMPWEAAQARSHLATEPRSAAGR